MSGKKENLPLTVEKDDNTGGSITYANDVVAVIAGVAANEVGGIAGMCSVPGLSFGKSKNQAKGVKLELGSEEVAIELYLVIDYNTSIQKAAFKVQENVKKAVESMTGLHVIRVDVHVQGVHFDKDDPNQPIPGLDDNNMENPTHVQVEFSGEPTPAEEHEPSQVEYVDVRNHDAAAPKSQP